MASITELQQNIAWKKEVLEQAKDEINKWKPTWSDYEITVRDLIDRENPVIVYGFGVSDILYKMNHNKYEEVCERVFQANYDSITEFDFNDKLSDVNLAERELEYAEQDLVDALDRNIESVD
tara:strand:- start:2796 stop:3161 length:366 start_codon:yes stop_codon:yes gene_type:complete